MKHTISASLTLLIACACIACGDQDEPAILDMSLRDLLGLAPERVAELDAAEKAHFVKQLDSVWREQSETPCSATAELPQWLEAVTTIDQERARLGLEPMLRSEWRPAPNENENAALETLPLAPEQLGLSTQARLTVRPLGELDPFFSGELVLAKSWNAGLDSGSEREKAALQRLEPALRRELFANGLQHQSVVVERVARAPFAWSLLLEPPTLLINPNILYLLDEEGQQLEAGWGGAPPTADYSLASDFIRSCVAELRLRCEDCNSEQPSSTCSPLFSSSEPSLQGTRDECSALAENQNEGFYLACYNSYLNTNLACFYSTIDAQRCGAEGAPYQQLEELTQLRPFLSDASCDAALSGCQQSRVQEVPPEDRPDYINERDDDDDDGCSDCANVLCDVGSICAEVECSDSDGGGCEGDDAGESLCDGASLCEGDANVRSLNFSFAPPFLLLLAAFVLARRP
ncbi:MAG: hypothetical protein RBU37_14950 [Myxococcota bacterium]|jgi:hypothetical protein|nr:hypothetical protein [Myxococcota bacterium]